MEGMGEGGSRGEREGVGEGATERRERGRNGKTQPPHRFLSGLVLGVEMQAVEVDAQRCKCMYKPIWMGFDALKHIVSCR